jgi:hypothetical protein
MIIDLTRLHELNKWSVKNDSAMGGRSHAEICFGNHQSIFKGNISVENKGGFSAVYRPMKPLFKDINNVVVDVTGDGQTYQLTLIGKVNEYQLAYKHSFVTTAGKRQRVTFSLEDFVASFEGQTIVNAQILRPENILETGFLLSKNSEGPFSLSVFSISFF